MICWLAKAAGVEASGQMRDEQLHAVVAQITFGSQNVQTIPGPDHCWKLRCRKSARRCGAKHIYTPCLDHFSKLRCRKWTPLWREAHFQVKTRQLQTAVVARSTFGSQKVQSTLASDHFWKLPCRKSARCCGQSTFGSLLFTAAGPMYCNESALGVTVLARRVRNIYYDRSFAEILYQELVLHHANVKSIWGRLHLRCVEAGNELGNLFPTHTRHWWPIVEDIFMSSAIQSLLTSIDLTLRTSSEYTCISIDATLKVAMSIKGQASYRSSAAIRNEACFGDTEALRRVLTVRGCTRAVLAMQLIKGEEALEVAQALQRSMSTLGCAQVLYVMSDSPSSKLLRALQPVSPNLRGLALDPVHTAIVYEYAQWRRRTPGSKLLRELLNKVVQHDPEKAMASWGCLYDGIEAEPLTRQEEKWREQILNWTHPKAYAERVVGNLKPNLPVYTRVSFIEAIAAKGSGALLDVQMSFRVAGARDCAPCQKRAKREGFVAVSTTTTTTHTHYTTYTPLHSTPLHPLHSTPLHSTPLHSTPLHSTPLHSTPLHSTPLHSTPLHSTPTTTKTTLHYTTLRYATLITLHYIPLHFTTLHYTQLRYIHYTTTTAVTLRATLIKLHYANCITLRYTTLQLQGPQRKRQLQLHYNYITTTLQLHYTTLHSTTFHYTILHYATLYYTTLHDTTRHYTTLHYATLHHTAPHHTTLQHYTTLHYITLH